MNPALEPERPVVRGIPIILASAAAGILVFSGGAFALGVATGLGLSISPVLLVRGTQVAVMLGSLAAALTLRNSTRLRRYWRLAFAYFVASCAVMLSDFAGDWAMLLSGHTLNTARGFTSLKLGEDAAVIGTIIVLVLLTRDEPENLFLCKGRLALGLSVGITAFLVLTVVSLAPTLEEGIQPARLRALLPAFLARIIHEESTASADMAAQAGVLGARRLRRTEKVRLGLSPLRSPTITTISTLSQRPLMNSPG